MCIIYFMRHGMTNEDTDSNNRVSGWNGVSLNRDGRICAARTAHHLKSLGCTNLTSSDTLRATQTAKIISDITRIPYVESDKLRSWNMGALQGMLADSAKPFLNFFEENPDITVPKGEKFRTFFNRFHGAFDALVSYSRKFPNAMPAIITHSQNIQLIEWFIEGDEPGERTLEHIKSIKPGHLLEVRTDNNEIRTRRIKV